MFYERNLDGEDKKKDEAMRKKVLNYEIKNEKLKKLIDKKAEELNISTSQLIWNYVNRGLMEDNVNEKMFENCHSDEYKKQYNEALGFKDY